MPIDGASQEQALQALIGLLKPERLALPASLHYLIPPPVLEHARDREYLPGATGAAFDHLAPSRAGADLVILEMLQPQRLARLIEQKALDPNQPDTQEVIESVMEASWEATPPREPYLGAS